MFKKIVLCIFMFTLLEGCTSNTKNIENKSSFLASTGYEVQKKENDNFCSYHYCYYDDYEDGFITNPGWKIESIDMDPRSTVLLIIDPWSESEFDEINGLVESNIKNYVLPVVDVSLLNGITVMVFTNNPSVDNTTKISENLQNYIDEKKIELHYYDEFEDTDQFTDYLQKRGIDTLVYTGYSLHLCVGYRNCGVVQVYCSSQGYNFNRYIIPEATLAVVTEKSEDNLVMRNARITAYSQQSVANVILFDDWINHWESGEE